MTKCKLHALRVKTPQPGAQQGRRLETFRKHPPARADKRLLSERLAPFAQPIRRKRRYRRRKPWRRLAVTRQELRQRLTVSEVQPTSPRHQELAACRRH